MAFTTQTTEMIHSKLFFTNLMWWEQVIIFSKCLCPTCQVHSSLTYPTKFSVLHTVLVLHIFKICQKKREGGRPFRGIKLLSPDEASNAERAFVTNPDGRTDLICPEITVGNVACV